MKLYGYIENADSDSPSVLEEVTVAATPNSLRSMASFFRDVADLMEKHGEQFGHEHFSDYHDGFRADPTLVITRLPEAGPSEKE